jgi:hypothetical protein
MTRDELKEWAATEAEFCTGKVRDRALAVLAAIEDAERYVWLCNGHGYFLEEEGIAGHTNDKAAADAAIDEEMRSDGLEPEPVPLTKMAEPFAARITRTLTIARQATNPKKGTMLRIVEPLEGCETHTYWLVLNVTDAEGDQLAIHAEYAGISPPTPAPDAPA